MNGSLWEQLLIVDEEYMQHHLPTVRLLLVEAGIRLGKLLNRALGGEYTVEALNSHYHLQQIFQSAYYPGDGSE